MSRVPCYVVTEITAGEPVGTHVFSYNADGVAQMCDMVSTMIEENGFKPVLVEDIKKAMVLYGTYRFKGNRSDDWSVHVNKIVKK